MNRLEGMLLCGLFSFGLCLRACAVEAAQSPAPFPHPLNNAVLAPALKEVAEREHISLSQVSDTGEISAVGDSEVFWVGAMSGKTSRQWLVKLTRCSATSEEQKAHRGKEIAKYLSWGPVVVFKSDMEALDFWIAGPVDVNRPPNESNHAAASVPVGVRRVRVFVQKDFLRLGLDASARVTSHIARRAQEILKEDPKFNVGHIYSLEEPIKPKNVEHAKPVAERIGFTPVMEHAWVGGYVALGAFFDLANHVPELKEIAEVVCEKPAFWKLSKLALGSHFMTSFGGLNAGPVDPGKVGCLPVPQESFDVPFSFAFESDRIVSGAMLVTKPVPPLDVSAGILALIAVHPHDTTRVVELRAISSTRGSENGAEKSDAR